MGYISKEVVITDDAIKRLFNARPIDALAEAIWNAVDARAKNINIVFVKNKDFGTLEEIRIEDDGDGIPREKFDDYFLQYQKSWKAEERNNGKNYHGRKGEGRFKIMSIARILLWSTSFGNDDTSQEYSIVAKKDHPRTYELSDLGDVKKTGTILTLSNLDTKASLLNGEHTYFDLTAIFALYLKRDKKLNISFEGKRLSPDNFIFDSDNGLFELDIEGEVFDVHYTFIAWKEEFKFNDNKHVYFLDEDNNYILEKPSGIQGNFVKHSVFLKSKYFTTFDGLNEEFGGKIDKIRKMYHEQLNKFLYDIRKKQSAEFYKIFEKEHFYPFQSNPSDNIDIALKDIFDVCAFKILEEKPDVLRKKESSLMMLFKLLKKMIEHEEDIGHILSEVLELDDEMTDKFSILLKNTPLPSLITHYEEITRKLTFLDALEEMVYDDFYKKRMKERSQLHKIIERETWIFGSSFEKRVGTSDKAMVAVLKEHMHSNELKQEDIDKAIEQFNIDKKEDALLRLIPDLYLWHDFKSSNGKEVQNLVVELKAPNVKIGDSEIDQIQKQRKAIQRNQRYKVSNTNKWVFYVVSSHIMSDVSTEFRVQNGEKILYESDEKDFIVYCKDWDEIIQDAKGSLHKEKEQLEIEIGEAEKDKLLKKYLDDVGFDDDKSL